MGWPPFYLRSNRAARSLLLLPSPIFDVVRIWECCQFVASFFRSLAGLKGGLPSSSPAAWALISVVSGTLSGYNAVMVFLPGPLESCLPGSIDTLLSLLGYPAGSVTALAKGVLRLRYRGTPFC